ncbi:OsmC family protein [Arthrobacter ruber]|uniref:OsmC family protein n=1 Tax=Arthrobacter ruber TaxID=1258893 RepID=UPI000CF44394|nr:OsmC family protein [Arthrobacter ruber]
MSIPNAQTQRGSLNGVDLDQLSATVDAVRNERTAGAVTFAVNGQWEGGFKLRATTGSLTQAGTKDDSRDGKFEMRSDEPAALLGTDSAVSPAEYVLQALAACYTVTLAANAASRGIKLKSYNLMLEADFDLASFLGVAPEEAPGASQIRVAIELDAPGTAREELEALVDAVQQRSPIRDTLIRPVDVVTNLV